MDDPTNDASGKGVALHDGKGSQPWDGRDPGEGPLGQEWVKKARD